jgi:phage gp29-like protein
MAKTAKKTAKKTPKNASESKIISSIIKKQESVTRKDIADWKAAMQEATRVDNPKQIKLQELYNTITMDALLTSQMGLRIDKTQGADFEITNADGKFDEQATKIIKDLGVYDSLSEIIIESRFYRNSLVEFAFNETGGVISSLVPRKHIVPDTGMFFGDLSSDKGIDYRAMPDFGKWIIEFSIRDGDLGILNKAVPHVLMKKFAQVCWSELCEIFGIPPRVLKTNTSDKAMLARAENMLRTIGSAAWWIIDTSEDFNFAQTSATNGDVYKNFIQLCNSEISMLVLGAVIGQDTANGNYSKEESNTKLLESIVLADRRYVENSFNNAVLPALSQLGVVRDGLRLVIRRETDVKSLWEMTFQAAQYFEVDHEWVKNTFGIEVTGQRSFGMAETQMRDKKNDLDFFL